MTTLAAVPLTVLTGAGADRVLLGGKGAWLDRLVAADFPVPPVAVVTTDAYRRVAATPTVAAVLEELRNAPVDADHERQRRAVDEAFATAPLPDDVRAAIAAAVDAVRSAPGLPVAVRSSATAEDLHGTSFAGQYVSVLDLESTAEIEAAVRRVWASLWYPAPRAYRRHHGVDESDVAMAAIVMAMVPARCAGVAFTADPGGTAGVVRVETVPGLGESLVSGRVTPTVRLVPRDRLAGPASAPGDDDLAARVAALALEVERAFGEPQDVEWAWDGRTLWLLQARPVTTPPAPAGAGDGFDTAGVPDARWTSGGIAEMLPGVLPPLVWTTVGERQDAAFRQLFADLGAGPPSCGDGRFVGRFEGRAALSLDALAEVTARLGAPPGEVERRYVGSPPAGEPQLHPEDRPAARRRRSPTADLRTVRSRRRAVLEAETGIVAVARLVAAPPSLTPLADAELMVYRQRLADLLGRLLAAETAVAAIAVAGYDALQDRLGGLLRGDLAAAERWAQRLTAGAATATWVRVLAGHVATLLDGDPALDEITTAATWDAASTLLGRRRAGRRALVAIDDALDRAGSAAVPAGPSWAEDPERMWTALRGELVRVRSTTPPAVGAPRGERRAEDWSALVRQLQTQPGWRRTRLLTGQVVDLRIVQLRRLAEDATDGLRRRERAKASVLALGGELRRTDLAIGRRLADRGVLREPADVELLAERELADALAGRPVAPGVLHRRRQWLRAREALPALPRRFTGRPDPTDGAAAAGDVLAGWRAAPGVHRGPAVVCRDPAVPAFPAGGVLVARTTDASWTPLFLQASAIVVEEGGPLSHAAILARELGVPAVVNLPGIVARLEGAACDLVVDGDHGSVTVIAERVGADDA